MLGARLRSGLSDKRKKAVTANQTYVDYLATVYLEDVICAVLNFDVGAIVQNLWARVQNLWTYLNVPPGSHALDVVTIPHVGNPTVETETVEVFPNRTTRILTTVDAPDVDTNAPRITSSETGS
jgi:hypothetical protein